MFLLRESRLSGVILHSLFAAAIQISRIENWVVAVYMVICLQVARDIWLENFNGSEDKWAQKLMFLLIFFNIL